MALTTGTLGLTRAGAAPRSKAVIDGHRCTIVGTSGNDVLTGTPGNDVICGLTGNDRINGMGGNDILIGGPGNDVLNGGTGNDTLIGGAGNDSLIGGPGADTASFQDHHSSVDASLVTHVATDSAIHQRDQLASVESLQGGTGNDTLDGNSGNNVLSGGPGNDDLNGGAGNDQLNGGSGNDIEIGGTGNDHISADSGDDVIDGSQGSDHIDCGSGTPTVSTDNTDTEAPDCNPADNQDLQQYQGSVTAVDTVNNTITVQWSEVNDTAQAWLDAQAPADPNPVTISLAGANIETEDNAAIAPGDQVEIEATTSTDGSTVIAVAVHAEHGNQGDS
jgi:Ca2+-binding RTX toxin-like protein